VGLARSGGQAPLPRSGAPKAQGLTAWPNAKRVLVWPEAIHPDTVRQIKSRILHVEVVPIGAGIARVILRFGFTEKPNVPAALRGAAHHHDALALDPDTATYYVGRQTVVATRAQAGMALWREMVFAMLNRNAELTADYFCIPASQVVEIGSSVEI